MHWWPGSSKDSSDQAATRQQRAARRTINKLELVLSEDDDDNNFQDCDTSINNTSIFGLDGADDLSDSEESNAGNNTPNIMDAAQISSKGIALRRFLFS